MSAKRELSWTPRLRGEIYCSPGCGGGCTREAFLRAAESAAKLADELGEGWEPFTNENLGWHWGAKKGKCRVSGPRYGTPEAAYHANLDGRYASHNLVPRIAILEVLNAARAEIAALQALVAEVEDE